MPTEAVFLSYAAEPIFQEGLDQWRHFEPRLTLIKRALGRLVPALGRALRLPWRGHRC
jgi:hypothetical protein